MSTVLDIHLDLITEMIVDIYCAGINFIIIGKSTEHLIDMPDELKYGIGKETDLEPLVR